MNIIVPYLWITITIIEFVVLKSTPYGDVYLRVTSNMVIFNIAVFFATLRMSKGQLVCFFSAFVVFLYLFHFGQILCTAYYPDIEMKHVNYVQHYMPKADIVKQVVETCLTCINCLCIGGFCRQYEEHQVFVNYRFDDRSFIYSFCEFVFWMTLPINLWMNLRIVGAAMVGGYKAANQLEDVSGIISAISNLWYLAFPFYYTLSSGIKKKIILYPSIAYIAFTMLTGNRGHQIVNLLSFFLLVFYAQNIKINLKKILFFSPIFLLILTALDMIFMNRNFGVLYIFSHFTELFFDSLKNNIIVSTIYNFGVTIFTPYLTMDKLASDLHPFFFESYIKSLTSIIPNVGGLLTDFYRAGKFTNLLNTHHHIGGSFIAELYYNCGDLYFIFAIVFGYYYRKMSSYFIVCVRSSNWSQAFIIYSFASLSLWWVRDSFFNMIRVFVWAWLLCAICCKFYKDRKIQI